MNEIEKNSFEDFEYVSWISNITGILQFQLNDIYAYRDDRFVGDAIYKSYYDKNSRNYYLFCSLLVDLRDEEKQDSSVYTRIFLLLKGNENSYLSGDIYLLDARVEPSNGKCIYLKASEQEKDILNYSYNISDIKVDFDNLQQKLNDFITSNRSNYIVKKVYIKLYKNGFIFFKKAEDSPMAVNEANFKSIYFFIKFIFHKDKFHDKSAENIIPVVNIKNSLDDNKAIEFIYDNMIRYVSEIRKNSSSPYTLNTLLGVIDYIKSFILICKTINKIEDYESKSEYLENLSDNINRYLSIHPYRPITIYQFLEDFRLFSFIILLIAGLYKLSDQNNIRNDILIKNITDYVTSISTDYQFTVIIITIILFTLLTQAIIQTLYNEDRKSNSFFVFFYKLFHTLLFSIKKRSCPNIDKYPNSSLKQYISGKIVPCMIHLEMDIRRSKSNRKVYIYLIIGLIFFAIFSLSLMYLSYKNKSNLNSVSRDKVIINSIKTSIEINLTKKYSYTNTK